jgi:hypothetical protein
MKEVDQRESVDHKIRLSPIRKAATETSQSLTDAISNNNFHL